MPVVQRQQTVQINYRIDGSGERAWLLFNGASLPLEFWDPIATGLAKDHTVVRFDQRNAGATRAEGEFTLLDTAADAAAVLEELEIQRVIAWVMLGVDGSPKSSHGITRICVRLWLYAARVDKSRRPYRRSC